MSYFLLKELTFKKFLIFLDFLCNFFVFINDFYLI